MKINFLFNVPAEHTTSNNPKLFINVQAEVIGVGTDNETCFVENVSGKSLSMLWELKPSANLFDLVSSHACAIARETIQQTPTVVTIAEAFYNSPKN